MKQLVQSFVLLTLATVLIPASALAADSRVRDAQDAAEAWLELVDAGKYDESWEAASELFRAQVGKAVWRAQISKARAPFGKLESRSLAGSRVMTELPGAPDGEYVVMQYRASFENKRSGVETVTPMLDSDGKWRVSGYYIK